MSKETAARLRSIPSLTGSAPPVDLGALPRNPIELFYTWLDSAVDGGVPEPLAASLATVDTDGVPDSRTLLLKDVDERGWAFAGLASSRKGQQLRARSAAALSLWWQPQARAVRVRGTVVEASAEESQADLEARSPAAQEAVTPGDWRLWRIEPSRIEFWQGSEDRRHLRIIYSRLENGTWHMSTGRGEQTANSRD